MYMFYFTFSNIFEVIKAFNGIGGTFFVPTNLYEICNNMKLEFLHLYEQGSKVQIDEF